MHPNTEQKCCSCDVRPFLLPCYDDVCFVGLEVVRFVQENLLVSIHNLVSSLMPSKQNHCRAIGL